MTVFQGFAVILVLAGIPDAARAFEVSGVIPGKTHCREGLSAIRNAYGGGSSRSWSEEDLDRLWQQGALRNPDHSLFVYLALRNKRRDLLVKRRTGYFPRNPGDSGVSGFALKFREVTVTVYCRRDRVIAIREKTDRPAEEILQRIRKSRGPATHHWQYRFQTGGGIAYWWEEHRFAERKSGDGLVSVETVWTGPPARYRKKYDPASRKKPLRKHSVLFFHAGLLDDLSELSRTVDYHAGAD